jgi:hypothetical protein
LGTSAKGDEVMETVIQIRENTDNRGVRYYTLRELAGIKRGNMYWFDWDQKFYSWAMANRAREEAIRNDKKENDKGTSGLIIT